jgi:hypothetical protein
VEKNQQGNRLFLRLGAIVVALLFVVLWSQKVVGGPSVQSTALATQSALPVIPLPAPDCSDGKVVQPMTEGPYYTPNTPERNSLIEPGVPGTKIIVTGYVLTPDCKPIANAWLDFWQADGEGVYDNEGFILRGHQFTDANGRYILETVIPGEYPGRTPHIHVKIRTGNGPVLTTQLYFPGIEANNQDGIFSSDMLVGTLEPGEAEAVSTDAPAATQITTLTASEETTPIFTFNFVMAQK